MNVVGEGFFAVPSLDSCHKTFDAQSEDCAPWRLLSCFSKRMESKSRASPLRAHRGILGSFERLSCPKGPRKAKPYCWTRPWRGRVHLATLRGFEWDWKRVHTVPGPCPIARNCTHKFRCSDRRERDCRRARPCIVHNLPWYSPQVLALWLARPWSNIQKWQIHCVAIREIAPVWLPKSMEQHYSSTMLEVPPKIWDFFWSCAASRTWRLSWRQKTPMLPLDNCQLLVLRHLHCWFELRLECVASWLWYKQGKK